MSDCDKYKQLFSNYLDGELSPAQRKEIDAHFGLCDDCQESFRQIKIIQNSLKQLPKIQASADFEQKLQQQIFAESEGRSGFIPLPWQSWKVPAVGSALVLATVSMFLVFMPADQPGVPGTAIAPQQQISAQPTQAQSFARRTTSNSSTLISDSSQVDSSQINREGVQLVGER